MEPGPRAAFVHPRRQCGDTRAVWFPHRGHCAPAVGWVVSSKATALGWAALLLWGCLGGSHRGAPAPPTRASARMRGEGKVRESGPGYERRGSIKRALDVAARAAGMHVFEIRGHPQDSEGRFGDRRRVPCCLTSARRGWLGDEGLGAVRKGRGCAGARSRSASSGQAFVTTLLEDDGRDGEAGRLGPPCGRDRNVAPTDEGAESDGEGTAGFFIRLRRIQNDRGGRE